MARTVAQRAVNNFTGGLVTEASPLSFPENSLSKAINFNVNQDSSLTTRKPFNVPGSFSVDNYSSKTFREMRKFFWGAKGLPVIAVITNNNISIKIGGTRVDLPSFSWGSSERIDFNWARKHFTLSFSSEDIYFVIKFTTGQSYLFRIDVDSIATLSEKFALVPDYVFLPFSYVRKFNQEGEEDPDNCYWTVKVYDGFAFNKERLVVNGQVIIADALNTDELFHQPSLSPRALSDGSGAHYIYGSLKSTTTGSDEAGGPYTLYGYQVIYRSAPWSYQPTTGAQPLRYRDFEGVPNIDRQSRVISPTTRIAETIDYGLTRLSASIYYNTYNAGWPDSMQGTSAQMSTGRGGTGTKAIERSLSYSTLKEVSVFPSLSDAWFEFKTDNSDKAETIGLYNPQLLKDTLPSLNLARKGSHILSLSREIPTGDFPTSSGESWGSMFYPKGMGTSVDDTQQTLLSSSNALYGKEASITAHAYIQGRMWYAVANRSFNIMFSGLESAFPEYVTDVKGLNECFQKNDPTSEDLNQILETDGGTFSLKDLGTIHAFVPLGGNILIAASNGVWAITGEEKNSFSPTSFSLRKVASHGISSYSCIKETEAGIFFVSSGDLFSISMSELGEPTLSNLTEAKIDKLAYKMLKEFESSWCSDISFDIENKFLVVSYVNRLVDDSYQGFTKALVLNLTTGSFFTWEMSEGFDLRPEDIVDGEIPGTYGSGFFQSAPGVVSYLQNKATVTVNDGEVLSASFTAAKSFEASSSFLDRRVDGEATEVLTFRCEMEIPYDYMGDPSVSKSVQTASFYINGGDKFFKEEEDVLVRPALDMKFKWDWDSTYREGPTLLGNIKYPEIVNYLEKDIIINNIKIPGSGRCLSLRLSTPEDGSDFVTRGVSLLGYMLLLNGDSRP